jgi:hypothetical protein
MAAESGCKQRPLPSSHLLNLPPSVICPLNLPPSVLRHLSSDL